MRYHVSSGMHLSGPEVRTLMLLAYHPYDIVRFPLSPPLSPAHAVVATLGHLVRANLDPLGWIRDASFELEIREIILSGDPDDLADIELLLPTDATPNVIDGPFVLVVHYREQEIIADAKPRAGWEEYLGHDDVDSLLAKDAAADGPHVMIRHIQDIESSITETIKRSIPDTLDVAINLDLRLYGLTYDRALPGQEDLRAALESPRRRRLRHGLSRWQRGRTNA